MAVGTSNAENNDENEDLEEAEIREASERKKRAAMSDSDDEGENYELGGPRESKKVPGQYDICINCNARFVVTVYSFKTTNDEGSLGYLCRDCEEDEKIRRREQRRKENTARKRRKKVAAALLDKQDYRIPTLLEICIIKISKHINDVEMLGDIGLSSINKISKILSRNRSLDDNTMKLFLDREQKELEFWDCSNIHEDALRLIPAYCPDIEKLTLSMCGHLSGDILEYIAKKCIHLTHITLKGPFLVKPPAWVRFFEIMKLRLKGFHISYTHRFDSEALISMVENCPNLEEVTLSRLDGLTSPEAYQLFAATLMNLKYLEISYPTDPSLIDDLLITMLLQQNGLALEVLVLDGCSELTDDILINGIRPNCEALQVLSLALLNQITDDGLIKLFKGWKLNKGLLKINLERCILVSNDGAIEVIKHSSQTIIELNINSLNKLSNPFFEALATAKCQFLTTINMGFVRAVTDSVIELLSENCLKLTIMEIYGNNHCTGNATIKPELKVIGVQSDVV